MALTVRGMTAGDSAAQKLCIFPLDDAQLFFIVTPHKHKWGAIHNVIAVITSNTQTYYAQIATQLIALHTQPHRIAHELNAG